MATDDFFVYAATYDQIIKMNKNDITDFGLMSLAETGHRAVSTLQIDDDFIYVTAETTTDSKPCLLKISKATMTLDTNAVYQYDTATDNIPYSMVLDELHVYTGMYTFPGHVLKFRKSDLTEVGAVASGTGEDDMRALAIDTANSKLYAFTNTVPGRIVKIDTETMTRDGSITLDQGENHLLAGYCDDEFVYTATNTVPSRIAKVPKDSFTESSIVTHQLNTGLDKVIAMDADVEYLYVATYTEPAKIARIRKSTLQEVGDALTLDSGENMVSAMANSTNSLFVGTDTSPARVIKIAGFLTPVDCKVSDWSEWAACSSTCSGGVQARTRTETVATLHGGAGCPEFSDTRACNAGITCPTECLGGKVWTTQGSKPDPTCDNANPTPEKDEDGVAVVFQHCQCPPNRPLWHDDEFCTTDAVCQKQVTTDCPATDLTCRFVDGRLILARHSRNVIKDFHCRFTSGSRSTAECKCLCAEPAETAVSTP
jgi:hypothetical protein